MAYKGALLAKRPELLTSQTNKKKWPCYVENVFLLWSGTEVELSAFV